MLTFVNGGFGSRRVGGRQNGSTVRQRLYPTHCCRMQPAAIKQPIESTYLGCNKHFA